MNALRTRPIVSLRPLAAALLAVAALAFAGSAPAAGTDPHSHAASGPAAAANAHSHAAHAPAKLTLDHGRKWQTDAALRLRMGEIRTLFADKAGAIHAGKVSAGEYRTLGAEVEKKVAAIVAECKLPPAADAMLHLVVADLVAGADIMQGKTDGNPAAGAHRVVTAVNAYGRYFDHPGWQPLA
jgi:hypothetical protein